jgi:dCMP deaminase
MEPSLTDQSGIHRGIAGRMKVTTRPGWSEYYMGLARAASARGDCTRRQVGAVIVHDGHVYGTGYNGSVRGSKLSCLKGDCPRGNHYLVQGIYNSEECACGNAIWPCPDWVKPGSSYDTGPGACLAIHSEQNAAIDALRHGLPPGGYIYVTERPCDGCFKFLWQCQLLAAFWPDVTAYGIQYNTGMRNPFDSVPGA